MFLNQPELITMNNTDSG